MSPMDEEKGDAMNGYSRLASYMGEGAEIAMFKRFTALNAHNLLLYQAELSELEKKLTEAIEKDEASGDFRRMLYDRYLVALQCSETDIDGNTEQLNTLRQIRKTLKEYNEALLVQGRLLESYYPHKRDVEHLQDWVRYPDDGAIRVLGPDQHVYKKPGPDRSELFVLKNRPILSPLARPVVEFVLRWYHYLIRSRFQPPSSATMYPSSIRYSQSTVVGFSDLLGTICASALPMASTIGLCYIHGIVRRLVMVGVFAAAFSVVLSIFTNLKANERFFATTGFAALQIVFVGLTNT